MSVMRDFEKKAKKHPEIGHYWDFLTIIELLEHARALEAMLKKHEWEPSQVDDEDGVFPLVCIECHGDKRIGHRPDCQLAKLLEGCDE